MPVKSFKADSHYKNYEDHNTKSNLKSNSNPSVQTERTNEPKPQLRNCVSVYVQTIPDYDAMKARCDLFGISSEEMMKKFRDPDEQKVFLPLAYQKICGIGIAAYIKANQEEKGKLIWRSFVGDEQKVVDAALSLFNAIIEHSMPNYPVLVTEDGGAFGLKNIYRKAFEFYQKDKLEKTSILSNSAKKALKVLFDDSDPWGDRQPNYLKLRFGKNIVDISDKYFSTNNNYDVKTVIGEQLFLEGKLDKLSDLVSDAAITIFKSYAMIQDLVCDLQLPDFVFSIEQYKNKVLKTEVYTEQKQNIETAEEIPQNVQKTQTAKTVEPQKPQKKNYNNSNRTYYGKNNKYTKPYSRRQPAQETVAVPNIAER
jgi:hypothetical protein